MIERAIAAGVPSGCAAADSVYGVGEAETARQLRRVGRGSCVEHQLQSQSQILAQGDHTAGTPSRKAWCPKSGCACRRATEPRACAFMTGPMWNWRTFMPGSMAANCPELWTRGLLIRRTIADGDLPFFSTGRRQAFPSGSSCAWNVAAGPSKTASRPQKNELGLDHNKTRSWHGWHRHVSLVMLASVIGGVPTTHANATQRALIRWSIQEIRRVATRLAQLRIEPAQSLAKGTPRRSETDAPEIKTAAVMLMTKRWFLETQEITHSRILRTSARMARSAYFPAAKALRCLDGNPWCRWFVGAPRPATN